MIETDITMVGGLQKHQSPRSDGICPCVNSAAGMGGGQTPIAIRPGYRVRKLTQKECWRLMGFADEDYYKAQAAMNENLYGGNDRSGSQLYKQAGNSIVVDVLCAIMGELYQAMPYLFEDMVVGSFFSGIGAFEKALSTFDCSADNDEQNQSKDGELRQLGYINDYNGDANRIYDGSTVARALKAEAGGGAELRPAGIKYQTPTTLCLNSKVNGKQPSLAKRIYNPHGIATAVTTGDFFMPNYLVGGSQDGESQN